MILVLEDGDTSLNREEIITLSAGIPLLIIFFILGFYAVRNLGDKMLTSSKRFSRNSFSGSQGVQATFLVVCFREPF